MSLKYRWQAWQELFGRYCSIFAHYWAQRHELSGQLLKEDEAEFLPAALAVQAKPLSPVATWTARILMALIAVLLLWSILGKVDIIANAGGKIIPSSRTKTIASVDTASVRALHVTEGQAVKAGQVLIELDTSASDAEHDKAWGDHLEAVLQAARAQALLRALETGSMPQLDVASLQAKHIPDAKIKAAQSHVQGQYADYMGKLKRIEGDIARYGEALPLATQRARDFAVLLKDNDVSRHAYLEKEQARVDLQGQLNDARNQRTAHLAETRKVAYEQLTEGNKIAASTQQDATRSAAHSQLLKLTSPVDGTVQQLQVHTVGGVVAAAQPIMQIVPKDQQVEVEASIDNRDIGFVSEGQAAQVKIDAFEYTKYGTLRGTVSHVSRDAVQDNTPSKDAQGNPDKDAGNNGKRLSYTAKILLARATLEVEGKTMPLSPGMAVNVEIKTGDRRIIEYVLSPLMQHKRESMNER